MLASSPLETGSPWKVVIMTKPLTSMVFTFFIMSGVVLIAVSIFAGIQSNNRVNACLEKGGYMVVTKSESVCAKLDTL